MRFVSSLPYHTFHGYVFREGRAVEVRDKGTIERCRRDPRFKEVANGEERQEGRPPAELEVLSKPVPHIDPRACPKCGRVVKQGRFLHVRHCKAA